MTVLLQFKENMLSFVVFFVLLVCIFFILWKACYRSTDDNNNDNAANTELQAVRETMSQRRLAQPSQAQPSAPTEEEVEEARQEREKHVKEALFSRKLEEGDNVASMRNIIAAAQDRYEENNDGSYLVRSWRSASSSARTLLKPECSICLETYKTGETICWAKTDECDHIFHQACILEWMKEHDDCPLCRTNLMSFLDTA